MAHLLDLGDAYLATSGILRTRSVTYTRGNDSVTLTVAHGGNEFWGQDASQIHDRMDRRYFDIYAAELILNGVQVDPLEGDLVSDGTNIWVVQKSDQGEPRAWWFIDMPGAARTMIRVSAWKGLPDPQ